MKYTGEYLHGKPDDVMTSNWCPQLDVLCHPKTKVFISHGGLGCTHETVYAAVPVVGIPLFADQELNINNLRGLGPANDGYGDRCEPGGVRHQTQRSATHEVGCCRHADIPVPPAGRHQCYIACCDILYLYRLLHHYGCAQVSVKITKMRVTLTLVFTYVVYIHRADCAKILGVFNFNGKSHFIVFEALMKGLAAKGHQVVVLNHFPQKNPVPNYTDIDVSGTASDVTDNITIAMALKWRNFAVTDFIWRDTRVICQAVMNHPKAQALLKSTESFDLVVTEIFGSECSVAFARKFKAPLINVITSVAVPWAHGRIGNPDHPAYIPNYFLPYTNKMNFWQRLTNTVYHVILNVGNTVYSYNPTSTLMKSYFGEDVPSVEQLASNASLVIVNSHLSINGPRPTVPALVEVGGIHIQKPKELPQILQEFCDKSTHGVVYFNLGSLVQVQTLPPEKLKALLDAFGALPESVLMKYTGKSLPGKPENVMTSKWLPQLDVLHHPKTKVFISHGGLGSTHETVYAGVPVVGIPLFADQEANINAILEKGMATKLYYEDITKDTLLQAIRTVIDNPSYSENAKRVSALFRDRPMTAMETAVYWVEYVIRHRGAPHLRSAAADMPLYQYLLLDVIGVLLLIAITCFYAIFYLLKYLFSFLTRGNTAQPLTKSKHE